MLIVWDEPKRRSNREKHGFDFADLDEAFFLHSTIIPAQIGRRMAIGTFSDTVISVVFAYLGSEGISIVSMRRADRNERKLLNDPT